MIDRLALLADTRVPDQGRLLCLAILEMGGEVTWTYDDVRRVLMGGASNETLRRLVRSTEASGWLEVRQGGKGHGNVYRVIPTSEAGPDEPVRTALARRLFGELVSDTPTNMRGYGDDTPTHTRGYNRYPPTDEGVNGTVVVEGEEGSNPPKVPPGELGGAVEAFIREHGDTLEGCRGALSDYLVQRVDPPRRRAYVATLLSWLEGGDESVWRQPDGGRIPPDRRTALLATALNELGATDEQTARKHKPGDPINLRNKLQGIIRAGARNGRATPHGGGTSAPTGRAKGAGRFSESVNAIWRKPHSGGPGDGEGDEEAGDASSGGTAAA